MWIKYFGQGISAACCVTDGREPFRPRVINVKFFEVRQCLFIHISTGLAGVLLTGIVLGAAEAAKSVGPLIAYVGTFSSPLRNTLPTQVDLPPGNGRGIHLFEVDRATGAMTAAGIHELSTSPSCLTLNAAGTCLYSANETDRVGETKEGTVSSFAVN